MNTCLTACRSQAAALVLIVLAAVSEPAAGRADYFVRTFAETAPAVARSPLQTAHLLPQLAPREPLTVYRSLDEAKPIEEADLDEATLAAMQALLFCAIPPPVNTVIDTTTATPVPQPGAPLPPPLVVNTSVPPNSTVTFSSPPVTTAEAPEPASLVTALLGTGLAGLALWSRRRQPRVRQTCLA